MGRLLRETAPFGVDLGGTQVQLRPLERADTDRARRAYAMLSEESRMNRFWEKPRELSPSRAETLTDTDNVDHVAWVALPMRENAIPAYGAASFWRDPDDPTRAELAFTIGDRWQRSGFATLLFSILWFDGWRTGLRRFYGQGRLRNTAIASWWDSVGGSVKQGSRHYELAFELEDPQKFLDRIAFGMPDSPRQVEVAEWMGDWLEKTANSDGSTGLSG